MFCATPALLRKVPNKLTAVKGTGAYFMETPRLRCESVSRYVARGGSLVVAFVLCLGLYVVAFGEDADKDPLNAELLRMLLLTLSFGLSVGWLLRGREHCALLASLVHGLPPPVRTYPT
jgi:hypothetical protein